MVAQPVEAAPEHRPVLPMNEVSLDRVYTYWLWYLSPFKKPRVSPECEAWVESGMQGKIPERTRQTWQRALARGATVAGDPAGMLTRKPGSLPGDREMYKRKGFLLCQRAEGEVGNGEFPYRAWRTELAGGEGFIGCTEIAAQMRQRLPWMIAQLESKAAELTRATERRGVAANDIESFERGIEAINEALGRLTGIQGRKDTGGYDIEACAAYSLPLPQELAAFFLRFDIAVLEAKQDARMKEQMSLQNTIAGLGIAEAAAMQSAREQLAATGASA